MYEINVIDIDKYKNKIILGDALEVLKTFPDECIDCVITSPPYWGLRDYQVERQIGLEPTLDCGLQDYVVLREDLTKEEREFVLKELGLL
jgi:DNA modification methylase